jgi:hypothetical protein
VPGPRRSLGDYVVDRVAQLATLGGTVRRVQVRDFPSIGEATIHATLTFGSRDQAVLTIFEHIEVSGGAPHRIKYGYGAAYENDFLFREDRDPLGHPEMPHHRHVAGSERRIASNRVTLHDVAEELWSIVSDREEEEEGRS